MVEYIGVKIEKRSLEDHVKRICRNNLKRPIKICTQCPILGPVIEIMGEWGWKYNGQALFYEPSAKTKETFAKQGLIIGPSQDKDLEGITEVKWEIFNELCPRLVRWYKRHPEAFEEEFYGQYGQHPDKRIFYTVRNSQKRVVGCGGLLQKIPGESKVGEISDIYLLAKHRGKGLGKALVGDLIYKARLIGFEKLFLTTRKEFKAATQLYKKLGFKKIRNKKYRSKNSTAWELRFDK